MQRHGGLNNPVTRKDNPSKYKYQFIEENGATYISKKKQDKFAWVKFPKEKLVNAFKIEKFIYGADYDSKVLYDYKDFLKKFEKLKKLLRANGMYAVYLENQGQWSLNGVHYVEYQWADTKKYLKKVEGINMTKDRRTGLYTDDVELQWASSKIRKGELDVSYTLNPEDKELFYELITQVFGRTVTLPKDFNTRISFKLKRLR